MYSIIWNMFWLFSILIYPILFEKKNTSYNPQIKLHNTLLDLSLQFEKH